MRYARTLGTGTQLDHRRNHGLYHPQRKGGRSIWGGGRPGRRGKLNGRTGQPLGKC